MPELRARRTTRDISDIQRTATAASTRSAPWRMLTFAAVGVLLLWATLLRHLQRTTSAQHGRSSSSAASVSQPAADALSSAMHRVHLRAAPILQPPPLPLSDEELAHRVRSLQCAQPSFADTVLQQAGARKEPFPTRQVPLTQLTGRKCGDDPLSSARYVPPREECVKTCFRFPCSFFFIEDYNCILNILYC
jgi:hypothetical protein